MPTQNVILSSYSRVFFCLLRWPQCQITQSQISCCDLVIACRLVTNVGRQRTLTYLNTDL